MLSCSWKAGLPTLNRIPYTQPSTFHTAAETFARLHHAKGRSHVAGGMGEQMSQLSTSAGQGSNGHTVLTASIAANDDLGEKVQRPSGADAKVKPSKRPHAHATVYGEDSGLASTGARLPAASLKSRQARTHPVSTGAAGLGGTYHKVGSGSGEAQSTSSVRSAEAANGAAGGHVTGARLTPHLDLPPEQQAASGSSQLLVFEDR